MNKWEKEIKKKEEMCTIVCYTILYSFPNGFLWCAQSKDSGDGFHSRCRSSFFFSTFAFGIVFLFARTILATHTPYIYYVQQYYYNFHNGY